MTCGRIAAPSVGCSAVQAERARHAWGNAWVTAAEYEAASFGHGYHCRCVKCLVVWTLDLRRMRLKN